MLVAIALTSALGACSSEDFLEKPTLSSDGRQVVKMEFVGQVVGFDQQDQTQTRATSTSWNDGDKIYITFYNGSSIVPGEATYSITSGWSVSYDGTLPTGTNLMCEVRYFVNAAFSNSSLVSLNANSEIYEDLNAAYANGDGTLTVTATLTPKTGRIRFAGTSGDKIRVYPIGIAFYTSFSPATNTLASTFNPQGFYTLAVASDGYTPYIYGLSNSSWSLGFVGSDCAFTRTCSADMLKVGESGYMAIPSESAHSNWRGGLYVTASGVEFKLIAVAGYSDGFYLIAETETTEALYNSVEGTSSTSQLPMSEVYVSDIESFITTLNGKTGLSFSLPTAEQWMYAAKGGNQSHGYTYAGSNNPDDVAWYYGNCTSKQKVKTKAPNELGIYDMSGNVEEVVSTMYNTAYKHNYIYGGCYNSKVTDIENTSNSYTTGKSGSIGFRLVLNIDSSVQ